MDCAHYFVFNFKKFQTERKAYDRSGGPRVKECVLRFNQGFTPMKKGDCRKKAKGAQNSFWLCAACAFSRQKEKLRFCLFAHSAFLAV
jgi:hypothetical protein